MSTEMSIRLNWNNEDKYVIKRFAYQNGYGKVY